MNVQEYIEKMKSIQQNILDYLVNGDEVEENYEQLIIIFQDKKIHQNQYDLKSLLYLISKISNNFYRTPQFFEKIEQILNIFKNEMKKYYSNWEIFKIFKNNKRILLFLIEEKIIVIDKMILHELFETKYINSKYIEYFLPEIKLFVEKESKEKCKVKEIEEDYDNIYNFISNIPKEDHEQFNEKRKNGQNDGLLYKLIQNDLIEEFIVYVNKNDYSLFNYVQPSIFETNTFLLKNNKQTLIEYAAFFGSIQIFNYLYKNEVELTSSLWLYAIHGDNAEIIHLLEEKKVMPKNNSYLDCIKESIKCHHNHIFEFIENNFLDENINLFEDIDFENEYYDNVVFYCFRYYNFLLFPKEIINYNNIFVFSYACKYDYFSLVQILLNQRNININSKLINNLYFLIKK